MKAIFEWKALNGSLHPVSASDLRSDQGLDLLSDILMDDGGLSILNSVKWSKVALGKIRQIKEGALENYDWGREAWSASITLDGVVIYSLLDKNCSLKVDLSVFNRILSAWVSFLQTDPLIGGRCVVEA